MKHSFLALCILFHATILPAARKKTPLKPPTQKTQQPPKELLVIFEYSAADALYGACTATNKKESLDRAIMGFLKGLAKMIIMKTFLDDKYYKTAAAAHLIMQNFTLAKNAFYDSRARKNLAPHMIARTALPVVFWYARALRNSKEIKWVW